MSRLALVGSDRPAGPATAALARAERHWRERRQRDRQFATIGRLFVEPAFDLLLALFIRGERDEPVTVGDALSAAGGSPATGLRWIGTLAAAGLVEPSPTPDAGPGSLISLSAHGRAVMIACFDDR